MDVMSTDADKQILERAKLMAIDLIAGLDIAETKKEVDAIFDNAYINNKAERIEILREMMECAVVESLESSPELPEDSYNDEVEVFLDGTWRALR